MLNYFFSIELKQESISSVHLEKPNNSNPIDQEEDGISNRSDAMREPIVNQSSNDNDTEVKQRKNHCKGIVSTIKNNFFSLF